MKYEIFNGRYAEYIENKDKIWDILKSHNFEIYYTVCFLFRKFKYLLIASRKTVKVTMLF